MIAVSSFNGICSLFETITGELLTSIMFVESLSIIFIFISFIIYYLIIISFIIYMMYIYLLSFNSPILFSLLFLFFNYFFRLPSAIIQMAFSPTSSHLAFGLDGLPFVGLFLAFILLFSSFLIPANCYLILFYKIITAHNLFFLSKMEHFLSTK